MKKKSYRDFYEPIQTFFNKKPKRVAILKFVYKALPLSAAAAYAAGAAVLWLDGDSKITEFIIIPFAVLLAASCVRAVIDRKRPYEGNDAIKPLIKKDRHGQSFPSRHTLSAAAIAAAYMHVDIRLGIAAALLAVAIGAVRVIAGVHYPSDVIGGLLIGYITCDVLYLII